MLTRRVTIGLLAGTLALLIGWDVYVATNEVGGDTISEITLGWSRRVWTMPLGVGVVCGHLFWPSARPQRVWVTVALLSVLAAVSVAIDVVGHPPVMPAIPFAIGVLIGHFGWGQRA